LSADLSEHLRVEFYGPEHTVGITVPTWPFTEPLDPGSCAITT
jgi:hypothetical protein